jgi:hypothetical protein
MTISSTGPLRGKGNMWRRPRVWRFLAITVVLVAGFVWVSNSFSWWVGGPFSSQICNLARDLSEGDDSCAVSCTWPATITGATRAQAGVIRCYLRALSDENPVEMLAVTPHSIVGGDEIPSSGAFRYAADARSGTATVTVQQGSIDDPSGALAIIHYADGRRDDQVLQVVNPTVAYSWRFWTINGDS